MAWLRLDDGFGEHPKIDALSDTAFRLHVCGMAYSARNHTDGLIPLDKVRRLIPRYRQTALQELLDTGLWKPVLDGAFTIHDFLDYNPSREQVMADRKRNADRQAAWREGRRNGVTNGVSNAAPTRPDPSRPLSLVPKAEKGSSEVDVTTVARVIL